MNTISALEELKKVLVQGLTDIIQIIKILRNVRKNYFN